MTRRGVPNGASSPERLVACSCQSGPGLSAAPPWLPTAAGFAAAAAAPEGATATYEHWLGRSPPSQRNARPYLGQPRAHRPAAREPPAPPPAEGAESRYRHTPGSSRFSTGPGGGGPGATGVGATGGAPSTRGHNTAAGGAAAARRGPYRGGAAGQGASRMATGLPPNWAPPGGPQAGRVPPPNFDLGAPRAPPRGSILGASPGAAGPAPGPSEGPRAAAQGSPTSSGLVPAGHAGVVQDSGSPTGSATCLEEWEARLPCGLLVSEVSDILFRELTPEDYDLLVQLDESVIRPSNGRSSVGAVDALRMARPGEFLGENCMVCLLDFAPSDCVAALPCKHLYHRDCVAKWLLERRGACPLCGVEVLSS